MQTFLDDRLAEWKREGPACLGIASSSRASWFERSFFLSLAWWAAYGLRFPLCQFPANRTISLIILSWLLS
jgi:hypothetical protein